MVKSCGCHRPSARRLALAAPGRRSHPLMAARGTADRRPYRPRRARRSGAAGIDPAATSPTSRRARIRGPDRRQLIGHSYGGMVATGVADRARGSHRQLIDREGSRPRGESLDLCRHQRLGNARRRDGIAVRYAAGHAERQHRAGVSCGLKAARLREKLKFAARRVGAHVDCTVAIAVPHLRLAAR